MNIYQRLIIYCLLIATIFFNFSLLANTQPNIIIFSFDDLRPMTKSYAVQEAITPNLDALALDSVQFNKAYVTYPVCAQSRAAMMTGIRFEKPSKAQRKVYAANKTKGSEIYNNMISVQDTWARTFYNNGYWLGTRGKLYHGDVPSIEQDVWHVAGPQFIDKKYKDGSPLIIKHIVEKGGQSAQLEDYLANGKGDAALIYASINGPDTLLNDGQVADEVIAFLSKRDKTKPFIISAGFSRPHLPFVAPKKYFDLYPKDIATLEIKPTNADIIISNDEFSNKFANKHGWNEGLSDAEAKLIIRGYLASTSFADAQMGKIITALKEQNLYENSIILMWGDHGYHLSDHGLWRKHTPYEVATRMPMMIKAPGLSKGIQAQQLVQNIDIYPTLLELAGIKKTEKVTFHGKSLVPILKSPNIGWDNIAFSSSQGSFSAITEQYRFTIGSKGKEYLFDLHADPHEWNNIVGEKKYKALIKELKYKLSKITWNDKGT
ncbi:sulfatase [Colwellia echini]|uniref:Sulfatase n=1 Tax=Colwellia echini TaxID=1982103 RepID=A0ABY3MYG9_9GAMM|nr:sulfatase [Colwellia echini]TYK66250.1 sulfatase [Colwellia echini]